MPLITTTKALKDFCDSARDEDFITVDTEFMAEKTYWPNLCLIQVATTKRAVAIDPLASGLDLDPLKKLLCQNKILKVIHSGRQDMAIFYRMFGELPKPIFDSQIAGMVCGFGESVSYQRLVSDITGHEIDKGSRFSDWSRRPLSEQQVSYALSDVTYLRPVYEELAKRLKKTNREKWIAEEMEWLTSDATYKADPMDAWERLKVRSKRGRIINVLQYVAAWREEEAQTRNLPRNRIVRDEVLVEVATHPPKSKKDLENLRAFPKGLVHNRAGEKILDAVKTALNRPQKKWPKVEKPKRAAHDLSATSDLLKVLLKHKCEQYEVAAKLIASADDLTRLAAEKNPNIRALKGWRKEVFGNDAVDLKEGRLALKLDKKGEITLVSAA